MDIECDNVKTHFRLSTSAAQPPTKGFSSGLPLVGEGMDGGGMPSSERLLKAYDDASASEQVCLSSTRRPLTALLLPPFFFSLSLIILPCNCISATVWQAL